MKIKDIIMEDASKYSYKDTPFYKDYGPVLLRGSTNNNSRGFVPFKYRSGPTDTSKQVHDYVNELAIKKFGIPVRSLLFVVKNPYVANSYGLPHTIIPLGDNFRLFTNPKSHDFTEVYRVSESNLYTVIIDSPTLGTMEEIENGKWDEFTDEDINIISKTILLEKNIDDIVYTVLYEHEGTLNEYFHDGIQAIKSYIYNTEAPDDIKDKVWSLLEKVLTEEFKWYTDKLERYIDGMIEITSPSMLSDLNESTEIMVYYPDGLLELEYPLKDES